MRNRILYIVLAILFVQLTVRSQGFQWAKRWGVTTPNPLVSGYEAQPDKFGNVYIVQRLENVQDLDYGPGVAMAGTVGVKYIAICKYTAAGNYKWGFVINSPSGGAWKIETDDYGNFYVAGTYGGGYTSDFDPGPGVAILSQTMSINQTFVAKYDSAMQFHWVKPFANVAPTSTTYVNFDDFTMGKNNKLYCGFEFMGTVDLDPGSGTVTATSGAGGDIAVVQLDSSGAYQWSKTTNGANSKVIKDMSVDNTNNRLIVTGWWGGTSYLFNSWFTYSGLKDIFFTSFNTLNGNVNFTKVIGSTGSEDVWAIECTTNGDFLAAGEFSATVDFDPSAATANLNPNTLQDGWLARYDINGNYLWAKGFFGSGNESMRDMDLDNSRNIWLTAYTNQCIDADPGPGSNFQCALSTNLYTMVNIKLDSLANYISAFTVGPSAGTYSTNLMNPFIIDCSPLDNSIFVAGSFRGSNIDFDPSASTTALTSTCQPGNYNYDSFFAHYLGCAGTPTQPGTISGNVSVCNNSTQNYSIAPVSGATSYSWSLPSGWTGSSSTNSISTTVGIVSGNVSVYAVNSCGMSPVKTLSVTVNLSPAQPGSISGPSSICVSTSGVFSISPVVGATSYTWTLPGGWSGSSTTNTILATPGSSGLINVAASNSCGAGPSQSLSVIVNSLPTVSIAGVNSICNGSGTNLTANGANTYTWNTSSNSTVITVNPTVTTTYTVNGTNSNGCIGSAIKTITVNSLPSVTITSNPVSICASGTATISATSSTAAISNYLWSTSATTSVITTNVAGVYSATITDVNGCVGVKSFTLGTSANLSLTATSNLPVFCMGNTATLTVTGATNYTWSTNATGNSIVVSPTANITYSVLGASSSCNGTTNISIIVNSNPTVNANSSPTALCPGGSVSLTSNGANTYTWSTGATTQNTTDIPLSTTVYTLTGSNAIGCTDKKTVTVTVYPSPTITAVTNNTLLCTGQSSTLTASGANTYTWNPGGNGTQITITPSVTTQYTVSGTDNNGCTNSAIFTQSVSTCSGINSVISINNELIIFPNPTSGLVTLFGVEGQAILVYNVIGEKIISTTAAYNSFAIDLSQKPNGIYFVKIGTVIRKIIKE